MDDESQSQSWSQHEPIEASLPTNEAMRMMATHRYVTDTSGTLGPHTVRLDTLERCLHTCRGINQKLKRAHMNSLRGMQWNAQHKMMVKESSDGKHWLVFDGNHRLVAMNELGFAPDTQVDVVCYRDTLPTSLDKGVGLDHKKLKTTLQFLASNTSREAFHDKQEYLKHALHFVGVVGETGLAILDDFQGRSVIDTLTVYNTYKADLQVMCYYFIA